MPKRNLFLSEPSTTLTNDFPGPGELPPIGAVLYAVDPGSNLLRQVNVDSLGALKTSQAPGASGTTVEAQPFNFQQFQPLDNRLGTENTDEVQTLFADYLSRANSPSQGINVNVLPAPGNPPVGLPIDTVTTGLLTGTNSLVASVRGMGTVSVTLTGTWVGTLQFEAIEDNVNGTWYSLSGPPQAGGAAVTSATANGTWKFLIQGDNQFRVRCSAFTSGVIQVHIEASPAANVLNLTQVNGTPLSASGSLGLPVNIAQGGGVASVIGLAFGASSPTTLAVNSYPSGFNGTNWDLLSCNQSATFLASAARTTTQTQADQTNYNNRGIYVVVDVTSAGTGSITPEIDFKDPASGKYLALVTGTAITANGTTTFKVYPGLTAVANLTTNDILPRTFRILITANNANSMTYSVGYFLIL